MEATSLDLQSIAPGQGDKYSPNLHGFLAARTRRYTHRYFRVYVDAAGVHWLGFMDDSYLIGARLMHVLCTGRNAATAAYANLGHLRDVPDFWARYQADGRCAIDPEHQMYFIGDETRWHCVGDLRTCLWCGKSSQQLERSVEERAVVRWKAVPESARA